MRIFLKPKVSAVFAGADCVLLDTAGDQYHCLPEASGWLRLDAKLQSLEGPDDLLREALPPELIAIAPLALRTPPPALPRSALDEALGPAPRLADWIRLLACCLDYLQAFEGGSFAGLLGRVRQGVRPKDGAMSALEQARLFRRMVVFAPLPRQCLARSFVLMRFLIRGGADATWVFGVRTWPFGAHCWVQAGDMVLDDHAERLVGYSPILAL